MSNEFVQTSVKFNTKSAKANIVTEPEASTSTYLHRQSTSPQNSLDRKLVLNEFKPNFSCFHFVTIVISVVTYLLDITLSIYLCYFYFVQSKINCFVLSIFFIVASNTVITAFSLRWYILDEDDNNFSKRPSTKKWIVRIIFLLLQFGLILRYIEVLLNGLKLLRILNKRGQREKQHELFRKMLDEDSDSSLLRLFHCFVHAAPQAILNLMLLIGNSWHSQKIPDFNLFMIYLQCICVINWNISIGWGITNYSRASRMVRDDKHKLDLHGCVVLFVWNLMNTVSRILALTLLLSTYPVWFGTVCVAHFVVMTLWLSLEHHTNPPPNTNYCDELIFNLMLGYVYIITFITPRDGPTRYAYLVYYLVCFMENTGALVVWCYTHNYTNNPYLYYGAITVQLFTFACTIMFMITYYSWCHPNNGKISQRLLNPGCDYQPRLSVSHRMSKC